MATKNPGKQRKNIYTASMHMRHKMVAATLSKDLRKQYLRRSIPLRKGDQVKIMRGKFKGKIGNVSRVDLKKIKIYVEGITHKKASGSEVQVALVPSNVKIIKMNIEDKQRQEVLKRKIKSE